LADALTVDAGHAPGGKLRESPGKVGKGAEHLTGDLSLAICD